MYTKIKAQIISHKFYTGLIVLILVLGGYYLYSAFFTPKAAVRYVSTDAKIGTLVVSISGTGQTSAVSQMDVKPKASGDILKVLVTSGQEIKANTIIAQLDATEAQKAVRDASTNLKSAQISLAKLKQPADSLSILQSQNAITIAQEAKAKAEDDQKRIYVDGYNSVATAYLDLSTVITGLNNILYAQRGIDSYTDSITARTNLTNSYQIAEDAYTKAFKNYKDSTLYTDNSKLALLLDEAQATSKTVAETVKSVNSAIQSRISSDYLSHDSRTDAAILNLNTYTDKLNSHITDLLSTTNSLRSNVDTISSSARTIAEKTSSLTKLQAGADVLDVQSSELAVKQRANALADAEDKLADYTIRAPYDSTVAKVNVSKGDPATSGTVIATIITKQSVATVSLNEVDVSKIKIGEKATLTFDAISDLTITGVVSEIDSVGTVSQGVVSYAVKIAFDTQDTRIKPGMSVAAAIITDMKQDVLVVPNSAVKTKNSQTTVDVLKNGSPVSTPVTLGLVNDSMSEIVGGLNKGDIVVTQTISTTATTPTSTGQSGGLRIPGITGGGGRG